MQSPNVTEKPRIIYLFYDGIGLGKRDADTNPFSRYSHSYLSALGGKSPSQVLPAGWQLIPTDAQLQVSGLPQSATGQTALWTGINGARTMGRHLTGFPGPTLIRIIKEYSIIKQFCDHGYRAALLNAYTDSYFKWIQKKPRFQSVSSHLQQASGRPRMTLEDLEQGRAIYMDYTHEVLHRFHPDLKERFPLQAARQRGRDLVKIAQEYELVIHEFFITDKAGHEQSWEMAQWCIRTIEDFLDGLVGALDIQRDLLLITSDHGNMEDLSRTTHTANFVPTFAYGKFAEEAAKKIKCLTDIPAFIYETMGINIKWGKHRDG